MLTDGEGDISNDEKTARQNFESLCGNVLFCRKCELAFEVVNNENSDIAQKHLQSSDHLSLQKVDLVSQNVRNVRITVEENGNEIEIAASSDVIVHYAKLGNSKGTFCLICKSALQRYPSHVKDHLKSALHVKNIKRTAENQPKVTAEHLLRENQGILEEFYHNGKHFVRCLACLKEMDYNLYQIKGHLGNQTHKGIMLENNDNVENISVGQNENDLFYLRRIKYGRTHMLGKLNEDNAKWTEVRYYDKDNCYKYYCKCCDIFLQGANSRVTRHACRKSHKKNVPNEHGFTQNGFEYDLVRACIAGEFFFLIILLLLLYWLTFDRTPV